MSGFLGLVADIGRLLGDFVVLNTRKSWWIARGRRTQAPCQHPSDSGRAGETGCDACQHLREPGRLRLACPLIVRSDHGWACSVASSSVRPYWGRAALALSGLGLLLYLTGATALFGTLRTIGYQGLAWHEVAWPGSWHRIAGAQSRHFLAEAATALRVNRYPDAMLALSSAVQSDPRNLEAALLLAQIWYLQGNFPFAERAFDQLERDFPEQRERIAITRHDTLVAIGQGQPLAEYALAQINRDRTRYPAWVEALIFGLRLSRKAPAFAETHLTEIAGLAPFPRRLVAAERLIQENRRAEAIAELGQPFAGPRHATYARIQVEQLVRLGAFREAGALLLAYGNLLGSFERDLLRLVINGAQGDAVSVQADLRGLLARPLTADQLDRLCAVLVSYPDRAAARRLHERFGPQAATLPLDRIAALWTTATLAGAPDTAAAWAAVLAERGITVPTVSSLDFSVTEINRPGGVPHLINTVQLPRPVVYALALRIVRK